jgi:hypothetical protein
LFFFPENVFQVCTSEFFPGGDFEGERRAAAHAVAVRDEAAAHFLRGQRGAVQAETVSLRFGGETV